MVALNPLRQKKSKAKTASENDDCGSPKGTNVASSNSTIGTQESNPQSPAHSGVGGVGEGSSSYTASAKPKQKRRNSAGNKKTSREDRNADDSSTKRSRSKSSSRRRKSSSKLEVPDSLNSTSSGKKVRKKKKEKGGESSYSSDKNRKKRSKSTSKKDKKRSSSRNRRDKNDCRENSPSRDSGSEDECETTNASPKRRSAANNALAKNVVASFEVASLKPAAPAVEQQQEKSVFVAQLGAVDLGEEEEASPFLSKPSPKQPSESINPTEVLEPKVTRTPIQERANLFKNDNTSPDTPGEHLDFANETVAASPKRPLKSKSPGETSEPNKATHTSIQERVTLFMNNNASPITPGEHLDHKAAAPKPSSSSGPLDVPKLGETSQPVLAAQGGFFKNTTKPAQKKRSSSAGRATPKITLRPVNMNQDGLPNSKSADDADYNFAGCNSNTATTTETGTSVQDAMNLFGGKVKKSAMKRNKSLDAKVSHFKAESNKSASTMKRSTSGGNLRNAYLRHLGSSDGDETAKSSPKPTEEERPSSFVGGGRNPSWSLASSLGLSSSSTTKSPNKPSTIAGSKDKPGPTGSVRSAYLNAMQSSGRSFSPARPNGEDGPGKVKMNAFAMFDPSLQEAENGSMELKAPPSAAPTANRANCVKDLIARQGQREGRSTQPRQQAPKIRSSSAGTIDRIRANPARKLLEAQFGKASQTTGTIGDRADAFSAMHGTSRAPPEKGMSPKAVRRTMNLNALNLATSPGKNARKKPVGPKRKDMKKLLSQGDGESSFADTVVSLLRDRKQKPLVRELCDRIQKADGLHKARRLSMRDNDLIVSMIGAIQNDPDVKSIIVDGDVYFNSVSTTLLFQFLEALGMNMHLRRLTLKNVQLGNDILYALATAMEKNFILEEIDMSFNLFTSEGLANFCQSLANNNTTCKKIMLNNQTTPVSVASEEDVLEAFNGNKRIMYAKVDFNSEDGQDKLNKILHRNKRNTPGAFDRDKRIIDLLTFQAERSEAIQEQKEAENKPLEVPEDDWDYLYELAVLFDKYKLKDIVEEENTDKRSKPKNADSMSKNAKSNFLFGQFKDILDDSLGCFNSDGSFLTAEFISKYLKKTQDTDELVFDFHGQWKLFKRFPNTDPARELIVTKFVDAIVSHPQMNDFMGINMANTGCGDDFLEKLSERCLADPSLLPNLHVINFESNFINERGCVALSKVISNPKCMRYLQLIRLENQKGLLTSKAEFAICRAMFVNRSVVVVSLQFRGLMERQQIHSYVSRNLDFLRQARQRHYKKTGTGRKRNETELFFDKIASNNPLVKEVKLIADRKFLSLSAEERVKAAQAFAENTHVESVNLNGCELDDAFAEALGKSLETNTTIEKLSLENNSISGTGLKYLFEGLAKNSTLKELRLHKQSKNIVTAEEDGLVNILDANRSLTKLGLDLRNQNVQVKVDRKLKMNDQLKRSKDSSDSLNYLYT